MGRPAGFLIDVPVTLTVAVRGEGLTEKRAKKLARQFANELNPSQAYCDGYTSRIDGEMVTEATLESSTEDREQFAQLIGYSLSGFGELSYVSDKTYDAAEAQPVYEKQKGE